jgi:hypothetical protein
MKRRNRTRTGVLGFSALLFCCIAFASAAGASNPANSNKPYSIVICGNGQTGCTAANPAVAGPGGTAAFPSNLTVTFTNKNKLGSGIQLGSDNLDVPATPSGFSVISTSLPACPIPLSQQGAVCVYLFDSSGNIVSSGGTTVGFRNLNLAPGAAITVTLATTTPPLSTPGCTTAQPCLWTDEAKQSNDFSGAGNDLNADSTSAYGTVTNTTASCPQKQGCSTKLADGGTAAGTATGSPGTVSVTINTSSGKTAVTQIQALDNGPPPNPSLCSGVSSAHYTYWDMFNGADNGADRSQTISITTTPGFPGFQQELCFVSHQQFTMKTLVNGSFVLAPANPTTFSDGGPAFQGLLPDCGTKPLAPLTVDCNKQPGVLLRLTNIDGTTTTVGAIPPGFDRAIAGN